MDQVLHQVPGSGRPPRIRSRNWRQPGTAGKRGVNTHSSEPSRAQGANPAPVVFLVAGCEGGMVDRVLNCAILRGYYPVDSVDIGAFDAAGGWLRNWPWEELLRSRCGQKGSARSEEHTSE